MMRAWSAPWADSTGSLECSPTIWRSSCDWSDMGTSASSMASRADMVAASSLVRVRVRVRVGFGSG